MGSFCLGYSTSGCLRANSCQRIGHVDNLQSCTAAYFDLTEVTNFIASNFIDGRLFFSNKEDRKNIRDNVRRANDARKLKIDGSVPPQPWLWTDHCAIEQLVYHSMDARDNVHATTRLIKGVLPQTNAAGDAEPLLTLDTAASCSQNTYTVCLSNHLSIKGFTLLMLSSAENLKLIPVETMHYSQRSNALRSA